MALLDTVQGQLDPTVLTQIGQKLGIDPAVAQTAVAAAVPMIVAAMAKHATNPSGAQAVQQAAERHRDVPDNIGAIIQAGPPADGSSLPGQIFGEHHEAVQEGVQKASGLDREKVGKLVMMLSPLVLGVLARRQFGAKSQGSTPSNDVTSVLQQESAAAQEQIQKQLPQMGGLLGKLFPRGDAPRA